MNGIIFIRAKLILCSLAIAMPALMVMSLNTNDAYLLSLSVHDFYAQTRIDQKLEWKMPINFWGYIMDESNNPIAKADVHFVWTDVSEKGTSDVDKQSDENGLFSLVEKRGKRLSVSVWKDGYYATKSARQSFEYAQPDIRFVPDQNNPVVFHLRKKGVGVDLITSLAGMSGDFPVHVPRDGTPIQIDLMQRQQGGSGQLQLSEIKPAETNWLQATQWSFKIGIPDGGLITQNDEFPFEAPENGYQSVIPFEFQKGENWMSDLKTNFYIKFGNPPRYGWLQIETGVSYGGATLTYIINPSGSRSLEPK